MREHLSALLAALSTSLLVCLALIFVFAPELLPSSPRAPAPRGEGEGAASAAPGGRRAALDAALAGRLAAAGIDGPAVVLSERERSSTSVVELLELYLPRGLTASALVDQLRAEPELAGVVWSVEEGLELAVKVEGWLGPQRLYHLTLIPAFDDLRAGAGRPPLVLTLVGVEATHEDIKGWLSNFDGPIGVSLRPEMAGAPELSSRIHRAGGEVLVEIDPSLDAGQIGRFLPGWVKVLPEAQGVVWERPPTGEVGAALGAMREAGLFLLTADAPLAASARATGVMVGVCRRLDVPRTRSVEREFERLKAQAVASSGACGLMEARPLALAATNPAWTALRELGWEPTRPSDLVSRVR